ncbi:MAG: VanW family protein [Patescibacteria group bacterium]
MKFPKVNTSVHKRVAKPAKVIFWFSVGALLGIFLVLSFALIIFQKLHENRIYPGVLVGGADFSGKEKNDVINYFKNKNENIQDAKFEFKANEGIATVSAQQIDLGYDYNLLATQAYSLGRSGHILSNVSIIVQAYMNGLNLPPSYGYSEEKLAPILLPITSKMHIDPVDSLFNFQNGKVTVFKPSKDGQDVDLEKLNKEISTKANSVIFSQKPDFVSITIPVKILKPNITTEKANNMGIKELIGTGTSLFQHSIPGRIYNVNLAASRLNGVLVKPDEVFSFNKILGDVSAFTGYQQAYIIQNGRTVLGDGGGVCQVSTTLFRALLDAGLPIVERQAHAYRVGYYEQDSLPGIDATVFSPTVDLKFKNDTGNYILIQTYIDPSVLRLTFELYGTKDGRAVLMTSPVILSRSSAPADVHQDDPTLPKGQVKQVDFSAAGANVYFTRQVTKDGKEIISDKFASNYRPWAAVYLHGTKEN